MARTRRAARRRKLIAWLLALPAIMTAAAWIASHFWFLWYCSLPPGTKELSNGGFPPAVKVRILAGAIHYTDDAKIDAAWRVDPSRPTGSMSLGTGFNPADRTANGGTMVRWSPNGFNATRWKPEYYPGNWNLPLYIPFAICLLPPALYWFVSRPRKSGVCRSCGYSRAGLDMAALCPECGKPA